MFLQSFDNLSATARRLLEEVDERYTRLVVPPPPGRELDALRSLMPGDLFSAPVQRPTDAACALAGLWLLFDDLDRGHSIVQDIDSPTGSFWHAIMHRREGDFSNSKYWYARCAGHDVLARLAIDAKSLMDRVGGGAFSGRAMVDLVAGVVNRPDDPAYAVAVELQKLEWRVLFDHCVRAAVDG